MEEFVSGERFQKLADVTFATRERLSFQPTLCHMRFILYDQPSLPDVFENLSVVFVYPDDIHLFLTKILPKIGTDITLLLHNSDCGITQEYVDRIFQSSNGGRVRRIFAQNVVCDPDVERRVIRLPIGIANSQWNHGNLSVLDAVRCRMASHEPRLLCYFCFNMHTNWALRKSVYDQCRKSLGAHIPWHSPNLSYGDYLQFLGQHKFAICPEGNGIDTHRLWECLYLGVIPIVKSNGLLRGFPLGDMPIMVVDSWCDITEERMNECFDELRQRFTNAEKRGKWSQHLSLPYYASIIRTPI